MRDIKEVAGQLSLDEGLLDLHGRYRAKVHLDALLGSAPAHGTSARGKYVLVTAVTPTPAGEGKTVSAIALSMGLNKLGRNAAVVLRQSSLGPTLGLKGGGAGGGVSRIEPLEESLIGLGSDLFAVESANNLLAALIDDALMRDTVNVDPATITWRRVIDMDDRGLRQIVTGLGGRTNGVLRETGFDITAASEVMAVLGLSRDMTDLRRRLGSIVVGFDDDDKPVTAEQLRGPGAMAMLLRDALKPNLMQTSEGTPAFIHTGPFGNIAHGNSSVVADLIALPRVDYLVTEAGFGADMGAEKLFHIKAPVSGLIPDAVVVVTTVRALKYHSGRFDSAPGGHASEEIQQEDPQAVAEGATNLDRHVRNMRQFGIPVVVAINRFPTDHPSELAAVREAATGAGALAVAEHRAFAEGGDGAVALAEAVEEACRQPSHFTPLYRPEQSLRDKVHALATRMYGAADVKWDKAAELALDRFTAAGYGTLPVCMAKTHLSISHDPTLKGAPTGYTFPIRGARLSAGAGFVYVLAGDIMTMPGLPGRSRAAEIDIDSQGTTVGLV